MMPLPRWVARFNKRVTNRALEPIARRFATFAVVEHVGRRTGRHYRTPINRFAVTADTAVVALTYGARADWVRNVLQGGGWISNRGHVDPIRSARIVDRADAWRHLPVPVRIVLRIIGVHHFLLLQWDPETSQ